MSNTPLPKLFVGIDWADQEHAVALIDQNGNLQQTETFRQDPKQMEDWIKSLQKRYPGHRILVALEQSRGPLFVGLADFDLLELFPINPNQLASYRTAVFPSGGKSDPGDATLLAQFLEHRHEQLRAWQPDDTLTRQIGEMSELRRKLVEERKRLVAQLLASLKLYFPQLPTLIARDLHHSLVLDLLLRWPSLRQLKRVHPKTLRKFLAEHGIKNKIQQTELIENVRDAQPLTSDKAVLRPQMIYAQTKARQIRDLNQAIVQFDQDLKQLVAQHEDAPLYRGLPGAGDALIPRLIAAMGSVRERYDNAQQVQCRTGIAPITSSSGKTTHVDKRVRCPTFLRQTFHEFADHARRWSAWSRAYYTMKRSQGMKHHAAVRALAYKWIRIIFRLWKDRTRYCEDTYIKQLKKNNSPIVPFLGKAGK
jgi:transposase